MGKGLTPETSSAAGSPGSGGVASASTCGTVRHYSTWSVKETVKARSALRGKWTSETGQMANQDNWPLSTALLCNTSGNDFGLTPQNHLATLRALSFVVSY